MENIKGICDMEGIEGRSIMPISRFYGFKMGRGELEKIHTGSRLLKQY